METKLIDAPLNFTNVDPIGVAEYLADDCNILCNSQNDMIFYIDNVAWKASYRSTSNKMPLVCLDNDKSYIDYNTLESRIKGLMINDYDEDDPKLIVKCSVTHNGCDLLFYWEIKE